MRSNRLFVFDMDGVLVASEKSWIEDEADFYVKLFGKEIASKIGDVVGASIEEIFQKAKRLGSPVTREEYDRKNDETGIRVLHRCPISEGADELADYLVKHDWQIALLSSSPMHWIEGVLRRLPWRGKLAMVLSLNAHKTLRPKPAPDGYLHLLKTLHADPRKSVALEDSNPGIASAKAAGLFTIGYREHLPVGYEQRRADVYVKNMKDVISIINTS